MGFKEIKHSQPQTLEDVCMQNQLQDTLWLDQQILLKRASDRTTRLATLIWIYLGAERRTPSFCAWMKPALSTSPPLNLSLSETAKFKI